VTNLIPDSWELPSRLAGDLINMDRFRDRERSAVPDEYWEPGQDAKVHEVDFAGTRAHREMEQKRRELGLGGEFESPPSAWSNSSFWEHGPIEPYDPSTYHEPPELYSQDSLDALEKAGFEPHDSGVWHRPATTEDGEPIGASHILTYEPGHRRSTDNSRAPWHLTTDPESVGDVFGTLRGPHGALSAADEDLAQIRKMPKQARRYLALVRMAAQSPDRPLFGG
jgi:hypothetical protein